MGFGSILSPSSAAIIIILITGHYTCQLLEVGKKRSWPSQRESHGENNLILVNIFILRCLICIFKWLHFNSFIYFWIGQKLHFTHFNHFTKPHNGLPIIASCPQHAMNRSSWHAGQVTRYTALWDTTCFTLISKDFMSFYHTQNYMNEWASEDV